MRNVLSQVPKSSQAMVSSIVRTIFTQPTQQAAKEQLARVVEQLKSHFPKAMDVTEGRRRRIGVHGIPDGALAANLFNESTGTAKP